MFRYEINGQTVVFKNEIERDAGLAEADKMGYFVQVLESDETSSESAFSKLLKNEVPTEEDFTTDPAKSADAVSETVAQDDTELPPESTFSDSPSSDKSTTGKTVKIGKQSYPAIDIVEKIRSGELKISGDISSELYEWSNGKNNGIKEGVTDETLLSAYIDKFPNAQLMDDFEGGALDEVILDTSIDVGEGGSGLFPDPQDLANNLSGTDFEEQKSMYEYMASLDPNVSVTYDAVGVQKDNKGDVSRYKSKNVFLNYTDPDTNNVSTVKINEDLLPKEKAAKLIDFGNKHISYQSAAKLADNTRIISNLSNPGGPLHVKPATIDAQFPNQGTMFDSYTKTVTAIGSGGQYSVPASEEVRVFPYQDELAAARESILEKNPDRTPEELDTESKIQVLANLKAAKKTEIITKRAENLIDGTRGSIFQLDTGIDTKTQGALLFSKASKSSKISKDSQVNSAAFDANLNIANTTSSALEDINNYLNGQSINKTDIRLSDGDIIKLGAADGSPMMISKAGVKITTNQLLQVQKEHAALTAASTELQKLYSKGTELNDEYKELQPSLAAVKLDYNLAEKYATSFGLGVTDIGAGLLYASYTLAKYTSPLGLLSTVDSTLDNAVDELAVKYKRSTDEVRASFVSDVSVDDAFSGGANFGKFVVQEVMAQGPVLLAMAASGGTAAPYVVGAWTAGGEGIDITYQDSLSGKKTGEMEKVFSMMGIGLANGVFTALTTNPILQRGLKTYRADGLGKEYLLGTRDYITQNWKRAIVGDNVMETAGEVATNVVENAIHGKPIFENVEHVMLSSVGFSFAFSTAPFIRGAALRHYNASPTQKRMDARIKEIISLQKNIDATYEASEKYGTGSFTEESGAVTQMKARIATLQGQNGVAIEKLQKNVGSKIDNMGAKGFQAVMNTLNGFKQRASVIVNNKQITPANKSKMLGDLETEFEMYHGIRKHFLDEATFGENFYLLEATDNASYERLINEAKIITKKTEGQDRKLPPVVVEKAIELYNRERIAENNAAAKKVDKNFQSFETVDDAVVYLLTELGDKITPETAAAVEQNILDGGAGAAIPLINGTVVPIAVVENQLTEGKTSVSIHEVGHPIVSKIFKNNPDQMIEFADNIDAWLQENNPALAARMLLNIQGYRTRPKQEIAEEKLMAFFEMVGDNKVDLNSKANASFSAVLAYNLQEIAGGSYNFNFKGPEEFAAFAAAIGTKIKNGDLSFKDVSMLSTKIKPPTTAAPAKKAEPTVKKSAPLQAKFDEAEDALNDAEDMFNLDPNDPSLKKAVEVAQEAYDVAETNLEKGVEAPAILADATEPVKKEKIVRPKADKSKRKYSLDKEVKKEIEPKIAEVQAINKVIKAEEKKLNTEAKQAIEDQPEVGDVTRTSKEKQLVELKENPVTINSKNSPDTTKQAAKRDKLQNEIVKALEVPISKAANLFTNVFYNKISSNAKQAVSRDEYLASAKANLTVMTINEFKPETINRKGENVINDIEDIIFQRGGLRAVKFAEDLGVVGKDQGTSRGAEALVKMASGDIEFEFDTKDSKKSEKKLVSGFKGEVRRPSALLANEKLTKEAKEKIIEFWEKNRGNKKVESFKKLPVVIDALLAEIYGVSEGTLTARSGNFNKETYKSAITAFTEKQAVFRTELNGEMAEVRVPYDQRDSKLAELETKAKEDSNFTFEEYAPESRGEGILRFLPELSVPEYKYFSGKRGRSAGQSTGMPRNFTDLAYLVTGRRTQAQGNREGEIQKMSRQELLEAIGAIDDGNGNAVPDLAAAREAGKAPNKMPGAQTLLSLIKLEGRMIANEMSREFGDLDPMTALDIEMGKNPTMYSKAIIKGSFVLEGNNLLVDGINTALAAEFGDYKNANLANVVDFIYKKLKADYPNNAGVARLFTYEYVNQLKDSDQVSDTEILEVVNKAAGKAYGYAFKYALTEVALNKTWDKLVDLKSKKSSDADKKKQIETFLKLFGRTFTNEKFLGMTTNEQLFAELAKATGLGVKGLKNLGFALSKEPGINPKTEKEQVNSYITLDEKVIEKPTGTDYIKKTIASGKVSSVNKAGGILNSEAVKNREDILSVLDPLLKKGSLAEATEMLALMTLGTNALVRKVSSLGKFIRVSPKDSKFVLEHETAAKLIEDQYRDYINNRGSDLAKAELDTFLDGAFVNVISLSLDEVLLPKVGGPERMTAKKPKSLINKAFVIDYAAQLQKQADNVAKQLPKNLRIKGASLQAVIKQSRALNKAITLGNSLDQSTKGISVWDFDDTLATTKSNVLFTMPDGTKGKIDAAQFAKEGDAMLAQGAKFDFSEFSKVVKGAKGPFFEKAMARNKKFGNENVYILTARPANSALAIHEFLKGIGLNIPLANITGLANSDPQAKANWVVEKFAEGYNDFYFADDHIGNVNAVKDVLSVLDVKSKVQQARVKYSGPLNKRFNEILEEESGIESFKEYESVKAKLKGRGKGRFKFFVPPSAEDFLGLLYTTLPKGKKGESAMAFYKEHLLDPYGKAVSGLRAGRITIGKNYRALKKELGIVPRKLKKSFKYEDENGNMKESLFSKEDAIRVYTWNAQGLDIPGLSKVDLPILVNYVNANPDLKAFADKLLGLNKNTEPKAPSESWPAGTITSDLLNTLNTDGRKQLLEVWQQNVDAIFTSANLNKLEAAYGESYVRALKDSLRRMRTGRNSTPTSNTVTDGIVRWLNAAVGNIMFLNRRSALLQLISFTNFINFEGNNLYQAGKAFANQPQYWKDWVYLMNSDYLVDRRDGLKINVNEADIATTAKENGFQGVLAKILQFGFIPTKMADSAAIATGGATFYRNKVNALIKSGMNKDAAEKQAMSEFVSTAEVSQQSSDPSKISKQQAEPIGRIILAFANTPSQYARIIKRAAQDLKNGRGDAKTHLSRIVYYGVLQNAIFNFLQQAMFAAMMGDDDDDETEELTAAKEAGLAKKSLKVANSMTDGILRGIGVAGAVVSVVKNLAIKLYERSEKTRNQNYAATIKDEVMKISPPISSKLSKLGKVGNAFEWGKKEIEFDEMSLKHPYVTAATNTVAAVTGLPLDRAQGMAIDAADIASDETETWMKPLIALGWPKWQLMSEEDTKKEREDKKERFKELEADKEFQELDPTNKRRAVIKELSKKEQEEILWNSGVLTRKQIRNLKTEANRVDKIMGLQNKKQFEKDMEALSKGENIAETPKVKRPKKTRKDSLK